MIWSIVIALFLVAHGLVHVAVYAPPPAADAPFDPMHSWLLHGVRKARPLLLSLAVTAALAFTLAGLGILAQQDWWRAAAVVAAAVSLLLLGLSFNPWLTFGVAINAAAIVVLTQTEWLSANTLGW